MIRQILGFQLDSEVFRSRRALVYRAHRPSDDARVLLKVLREVRPSPEQVAWFRRESEITQKLSDIPGVIRPLDFGCDADQWAMVLEDVGGASLAECVREGPMPLEEVLLIGHKVAESLQGVHSRQFLHKDINPNNIVYNRGTGQVRLIDFGIASPLPSEVTGFAPAAEHAGTLAYMAPEQTGRMNRAVDHRADLYSLGATLYQLLTGRLPFAERDEFDLIHAHIARMPQSPAELAPALPPVVAAIVLKLMAKNAEDRYQSAGGIGADLLACHRQWRETGTIGAFPLDAEQQSTQLVLPQKLYGRANEIEQLTDAFERTACGATELLLVAGYSGVGKTAVVQELHRPLTQRHGYWIAGKFDQYQRDVPYSSIVVAFAELVRQVLGESAERVAIWRQRLDDALGAQVQLITALLPELAGIVGEHPPAPELPPAEAQVRFEHTFAKFAGVFAGEGHPLTLFLDDLQWADAGSLALLEGLFLRSDVRHLLVLGAYRDNEVGDGHPLRLLEAALQRAGKPVQTLQIRPLEFQHLAELVADTLHQPVPEVRRLVAQIHQKTHGNPFFAREFLKALAAEKLLRIDGRGWVWDLPAIVLRDVTDNVVDFMAAKLRALPQATQDLLQLAGALGPEFSLQSVVQIAGTEVAGAWGALWPAVSAGLIIPLDESWKLIGIEVPGQTAAALHVRCKFVHDRVQQAAYSLLPVAERPRQHWQIGQRMLQAQAAASAYLFSMVGHLNAGVAHAEPAQRVELASLNLKAAQRAKASAAFATAREYARVGLALAPSDPGHRELRMALLTMGVETAYQTGAFDEMDQWFAQGRTEAADPLELAWMQEITTEALNARGRPLDALSHAMDYLDQLGVSFARAPSYDDVVAEMTAAAQDRSGRSLDELAAMPDMTDPKIAVAVALICKVYSSAYVASPLVFALITLRQFRLVLRHGNCPVSALAYAVYGLILAALAGDVKTAYEFGQLSERMLDRPDIARYHAQALHLFSCHTRMWREHLRRCADGERQAYRVGLQTGEMEFGSYGGHVASKYAFFHGQELLGLLLEIQQYTTGLRRYRNVLALTSHLPWHQAVDNLISPNPEPWKLKGPHCDFDAELPQWLAVQNRMAISNAYLAQLQLAYLFGETREALRLADEGAGYLDAVLSQYNQPQHAFFAALTRLRAQRAEGTDAETSAKLAQQAQEDLDKLRGWEAAGPINFAHRVALVEAEQLRVAGQFAQARDRYEDAIHLAHEHEFHSDEALAFELSGRFFLAHNRKASARFHLREAAEGWHRWGALNKALQLEQEFPDFIRSPAFDNSRSTSTSTTANTRRAGALEFEAVVRASQAIASEVVLPNLLSKLVVTLMENAGAARAVLLLDHNGELRIEAEAHAAPSGLAVRVEQSVRVAEDAPLPMALINYVVRSGQTVVLDDALMAPLTATDPYAQMARLRSVLCQPIVGQGRFRGIIYLENSLTPSVFTPDRSELIGLLAGQIAVAIDNARLYATLEQRVAERTAQLEARNSFIRKVFGRYVSDDVVDTVLQSQDALALGGERRVVTIMFTDIRGFTSMCEVLRPEAVVQMLNNYIRIMTGVITQYQGTIDNIIGDGMVVLFGAPLWRDDDADRAVACGVAMQLAMAQVNDENMQNGLPELELGIGIHTGDVVVGNIGSEQRAKYSVIGRNVNIASRVESMTSGGQVFATGATRKAAMVPLRIDGEYHFNLKGVNELVAVHQIGAVGGRFGVSLPVPRLELVPQEPPVPAQVRPLRGKLVGDDVSHGSVIGLGVGVLELVVEPRPAVGQSVAVQMHWPDGSVENRMGKVAEHRPGSVIVRYSAPVSPRSRLSSGIFSATGEFEHVALAELAAGTRS